MALGSLLNNSREYNMIGADKDESSLDRGISNEEEELGRIWSPYLYSLQRRAPKSRILPVETEIFNDDESSDLGIQYHGLISKADAVEKLLHTKQGTYLVRKKPSGQLTVSFKYSDDDIKHYSIKTHGGNFLYGDKEFESINDLVDDSLISLYLEQHDISKHLTLARQNRNSQWKRRKGRRYKTEEEQKQLSKWRSSRNSLKSSDSGDAIDGVFRELSPKEMEEEPVQVFIQDEGEGGKRVLRPKASSEKVKRKRVHRRREGNMTVTDRTSCPQEIVNLLSIYTRSNTEGASTLSASTLNKKKSVSAGNLVESNGAIGQLLKNTLLLPSSDEELSRPNDEAGTKSSDGVFSRSSSTSSYVKPHNFKVATYKGPTWCDICHHFLWGLVQQGTRCQDCGINVHKLCLEDANEVECVPTKKLVKRVFGIDLTTVVLIDDDSVPKFLKQSIAELESRGLDTEGLYRVAGRTLHIMDLKDKVDENNTVDFSLIPDVHVISAAIKLFLRELPIPLISFDAYPHLLASIQDDQVECSTIKQLLIDHLPKAHYDTLHVLIHHLTRVVEHSNINKMQSSNLAVVFAPTIMRSPHVDDLLLKDIPLQKKLVEYIIDNYTSLFDDP